MCLSGGEKFEQDREGSRPAATSAGAVGRPTGVHRALGSAGVTQVGVEDGKDVLVAGVLLREDEIRVALDE